MSIEVVVIGHVKIELKTFKALKIKIFNFELESNLDLYYDVKCDGECDGDDPGAKTLSRPPKWPILGPLIG